MYAFGGGKLPYCMSCAMFAGGVRTAAARPALGKREMKRLVKAHKAGVSMAASPPQAAPAPAAATVVGAMSEPTTDWEKPWWEDRQPSFAD